MEDELDVDIEGDEFDNNIGELGAAEGLMQEQFLQSTWKNSPGILPWELDSSISAENREVIEKMLLEEQYYLTGKEIPKHVWNNVGNKTKVKRSQTKTSASNSSFRWSKQEKELFEVGLTKFGRRWTKIAKMVGTRTVFQVKNYARQYFKHKAKDEPTVAAVSSGPAVNKKSSTSSQSSVLTNAVRIERLSGDEDEEVDITDDITDDDEEIKEPVEIKREQSQSDLQSDYKTNAISGDQVDGIHTSGSAVKPKDSLLVLNGPDVADSDRKDPTALELSEKTDTNSEVRTPLCEPSLLLSCQEDETDTPGEDRETEEEEGEDEEDLKIPEQEIELDLETVTDDEKQAIPEFFEGRPSKTPERYLKIRNYIVDQWLRSKPKYLNKTSVRPGLKNCGDVNCIGRIHTYLELIGAINFNCEQAVYNRPKVVDRYKHKESKDVLEAYQLAQRLQSMRTRKRRVRDTLGNWCDAKDLEGQTYEHLSAEELALQREKLKKVKLCKASRQLGSVDPFQLIPCRSFGEEVQEPFQVIVCAETLLIMDMHAHVSRGEVIGLLGGTFYEKERILKISVAEPCNSVSTGLQCEMDPVSQTQACEVLTSLGFSVVGWYHSHPTFNPNPSVRDIHTQDQFQSYFSRGGAPFIGMIVSPYDPSNPSPHSQTTCLLVKESQTPSSLQKLPYKFDFLPSQDIPNWDQTLRRATWIIQKYSQASGSVQMNRMFRRESHLTCLEKMLSSLARYLEPLPDEEGEIFLTQIHSLFLSDFVSKQHSSDLGESEPVNASPRSLDLCTGDDSVEDSGETSDRVESEGNTVLHMGSVLTCEHDYLL
ncbi:histone H2A deubiquitinase MYSM1 isoform X1 [Synchiropus splendidus]|uniref:histone H2A deubiquitinase MYSM1 isoform X1 n=2 Tax=Synchiropus splendidus TaxID=270530 RepID=UPI00237DACF7|nr:histone H2A deubiquitinase MYSM1 isoform X1 [Synchiropus splendidus]